MRMERSTLLVRGERNEHQPERYRREAVKALDTLAVAERDILTRLARSNRAHSDDSMLSRTYLALSIHQDNTAPHRATLLPT